MGAAIGQSDQWQSRLNARSRFAQVFQYAANEGLANAASRITTSLHKTCSLCRLPFDVATQSKLHELNQEGPGYGVRRAAGLSCFTRD
jgi:hypothetical protein